MIREIAVKTLTGRGKASHRLEKKISLNNRVSKTLGCWIINLNYDILEEGSSMYLKGSYSLQLWYAYDEDKSSSVYEENVEFNEKLMMVYRDVPILSNEKFFKVYVNKYPSTVYMNLNEDNSISLTIEALYYLDVFQEAIVAVDCKENVKEELTTEEEILFNVNENYLVNND